MTQPNQSTQDNQQTQAQPQNQPPAQTSTPPPAQPSTQPHNGPGPGQQLLEAINALPERIVNSLRESQPARTTTAGNAPAAASQQGSGQSATAATSNPQAASPTEKAAKEPGKKTFAQWWFGG